MNVLSEYSKIANLAAPSANIHSIKHQGCEKALDKERVYSVKSHKQKYLCNFFYVFWCVNIYNKVDRCLARYSPRAQTDLPNQLISEPVIGHICAEMVPNWKTERNQSCLRIWGSYDPIECSPSEPQKWVLQGVA